MMRGKVLESSMGGQTAISPCNAGYLRSSVANVGPNNVNGFTREMRA